MGNEQSTSNLGEVDRQLGLSSPPRSSPKFERSYGNVNAANPVQPVLTTSGVRLDTVDEYVINYRRKIGEGGFGAIYEATSKKSNKKYAVKVITLKNIPDNFLESLNREILIAESLNHPNIVKVRHTFRDNTHVYIVMDLYEGGDIYDFMDDYEYLNECMAFVIFGQLVEAVGYLHANNIVHRDIKVENMVFDNKKHMHVALTDFGFAVVRDPNGPLLDNFPGSVYYAAPELFLGNPYTGYAADVWAMGVCLYLLLTGDYPADTTSTQTYSNEILNGTIMLPTSLSPAAQDLLTRMLQKNEAARATVEDIRYHPWMNYWREHISTKKCPASPRSGGRRSNNQPNSGSIGALSGLGVGVLAGLGNVVPLASGRNVAQPISPVRAASPPSGWDVPSSGGFVEALVNSPKVLMRSLSGMFRSPGSSVPKDAVDTGLAGGGFNKVFVLPPAAGSATQGNSSVGASSGNLFGSLSRGSAGYGVSSPYAFTPSSMGSNTQGSQIDVLLSNMGL